MKEESNEGELPHASPQQPLLGPDQTEDASEDPSEEDRRGVSLFMTAAHATKSALGGGILSLSWAFFYGTMWPGIFFTAVMCFLSAYGYYILGVCCEKTDRNSYGALWKHCFGYNWAWLTNLVIVICLFFVVTAYLIVCGDYVPRALVGLGFRHVLQNRRVVILLVSLLVAPLNFLPDVSFLGCTSSLGTLGSLYTCGVLFFEAVNLPDDQRHPDWEPVGFGPGLFLMIPTVTFAFNGHCNAPEIYHKLDCRSPARWKLVTVIAFGLIFVISLVCSISGYVMFGTDLSLRGRSNVLNAPVFANKSEIMVAYLGTIFSVVLGIPLQVHAMRSALEMLWLRHRRLSYSDAGKSPARRKVLTIFCIVITTSLSMVVEELGLISAICGAVGATLLMFIFPSMMYLHCTSPAGFVSRVLPWCLIIAGCFVGVTGVVTSVLTACGYNIKSV